MSEPDRGQLSTAAAEIYDDLFVPALFGRFAEPVAAAAEIGPAEAVVDVACGTGALTRAVRARTTGRVVGVDVNPGMLAVAGRHGDDGIEYVEANAEDLPFTAGEFDVSTSQFGLIFYPEPARGLGQLTRVSRRGVVAVWDDIERSAGYSALREVFRDELGPAAATSLDAPFAMGVPGVLEAHCAEAEIESVRITSIEGTGRFDSIDHWVTTEVRGWTLRDSVSDERLAGLLDVARQRLGRFETAGRCVFGIAAKVATWTRN